MHIKGWVKTSLVDFPERIAASLFCGGCNFRCPNCHNSDIVLHPSDHADLSEIEIWSFLRERVGLLDGIVISGGEPTLQQDLLSFCLRVRGLGYRCKLDTNGYRPEVVQALIDRSAVDYVAMDVKAPLLAGRYGAAAGLAPNSNSPNSGTPNSGSLDVERIRRTIDLLLAGKVAYEFRTTVVPGLLAEPDIVKIAQAISGARRYYLQQFVAQNTLDPQMLHVKPYPAHRVRDMADLARQWVDQVEVRGI
jgi:pyruvate formate lyase activating enzyme